MAAFDLDEQEQISELKAWWARYGSLLTGVALILTFGLLGWTVWQHYQIRQSQEAAGTYAQLEKAILSQDSAKARELSGHIMENFASSIYADLAAMKSANLQAQSGDLANAHVQLKWVVEKGHDDGLRAIARLRLAAVLADRGMFDEALSQLQTIPAGQKMRFEDARGDVLAAQGKLEEAKTAWKSALAELDLADAGADRVKKNIETKLETVGL